MYKSTAFQIEPANTLEKPRTENIIAFVKPGTDPSITRNSISLTPRGMKYTSSTYCQWP